MSLTSSVMPLTPVKPSASLYMTPLKVERWFERIAQGRSVSELIGLFGLTNATEVTYFLKSPAGLNVSAAIREQIQEIAFAEEKAFLEWRDQQLHEKRALAYLLLGLLYNEKKQERVIYLNDMMERQQKQTEHTRAASSTPEPKFERKQIDAFNEAVNAMQAVLEAKIEESNQLLLKLTENEKQIIKIHQQYERVYQHLHGIHHFLHHVLGIDDLTTEPFTKAHIETLQQYIHEMATAKDELTTKAASEAEKGSMDESSQTTVDAISLELTLAALKELLAALKGDYQFYKSDGTLARTYAEADLLLPRHQPMKIVHYHQKNYLVPISRDFEDLNLEEREEARQDYLDRLTIQRKNQRAFKLEVKAVQSRRDELHAQRTQVQTDLVTLSTHVLKLSVEKLTLQSSLSMKPVPTKAVPIETVCNSYACALRLMNTGKGPTVQEVKHLKQSVKGTFGERLDKDLNRIKPNAPIPDETMRAFVQNIARWGIQPKTSLNTSVPMDSTPRPCPRPG